MRYLIGVDIGTSGTKTVLFDEHGTVIASALADGLTTVHIDALNDEKIAELRAYHEETVSLVKHFYLDIPMDVCTELREFEEKYSDKLLGHGWREYLHDSYEEFKEKNWVGKKSEAELKAEFKKQILSAFYDAMDYIFREDFGTSSQTAKKVFTGLTELLFGKES